MTEETGAIEQKAAQLYAALAKAQGQFLPIEKNRTVMIKSEKGSYQFRYADLEEILSKTRPALSANGLALIQRLEHNQGGPLLTCLLAHASGGVVHSEISLPSMRDMGDPKKFGAALTYLRRYMVTAILGVAADDDLDEDGQGYESPASSHPKLQEGRDAALQGMQALTDWWGGLSAQDRKALNGEFPKLRTAAQTSDRGG